MKTKDFINMLQKADPTGEGYIRLPDGGAPWFAEAKEGYWDGPYQYLEKRNESDTHYHNATLITSSLGYKVDIYVKDTVDIIWDEKGDMDRIRKRIRFDYSNYANSEQQVEKEQEGWKYIEKEAKYARGYHEASLKEWTERVVNEYVLGEYEIRQPLDKPIGMYHCMTAHTMFKKKQLCQGDCMAIIESGKFYPEKGEKYYIWHYDEAKGQNWSIKGKI
jgi:hypothetical protein